MSDLISPYVDGQLPLDTAESVRQHTEGCAACRAELAAEHVSAKALESPRMAFDAPEMLAEIKRQIAETERPRARVKWQWALAGAAATCCLVWLGITLTREDVGPRHVVTAPNVQNVQPPAAASDPPMVQDDDARSAPEPKSVAPKDVTVRRPRLKNTLVRSPEPRKNLEKGAAATTLEDRPAPEIEYLVVYNHSGLGDGIDPAEAANGAEAGAESSEASAYSISMIDESTGEVTNVSAYSSLDGDSGERATVEFRGSAEDPARDESERSSTDDKPLDCAGSADLRDLC